MRTWFSTARRSLAIACLGVAIAVPAVAVDASSASAALGPVVGCGFHFGPISEEGAAGTLVYTAVLEPANPAQRCTTAVTFTLSAKPSTGGSYTTIDNNPLTATQTVAFVPGRLPPTLRIEWALFHCADPPGPGALVFASGGQSGSVGITPTTCGPPGSPHSRFDSFPLPPVPSAVGIARTPDDHGYRSVSETGVLTNEGDATQFVTAATNSPVVGVASPRTGNGAWVAAADGGVFTYGTAAFEGSLGGVHLNQPVVGIAPTPSGHGYWLVASDGGVFSFGTAKFAGSLGSVLLNAPIVGIAAGPHTGYWLVGSDGSVFAFGGVPFEGSLGAVHLNAPVSGIAATSTGKGYWLVGADNGIFTFGDAHFFGSNPTTFP